MSSYRGDRGSPILLESGLKSFLGHPGHTFPLINGKPKSKNDSIEKNEDIISAEKGQTWPRDSNGYIALSAPDESEQYQGRTPICQQHQQYNNNQNPLVIPLVLTTHDCQRSNNNCEPDQRPPWYYLQGGVVHTVTSPVGSQSSPDTPDWTYHQLQPVTAAAAVVYMRGGADGIEQGQGNSKPSGGGLHGAHGHAIKDLAGSILAGCGGGNGPTTNGNGGGGGAGAGAADEKKDDGELWNNVEAQTAFLGPNLWDKTYETDLKYVDLDEFLSENGVSMDGLGSHGSLGPLGSSHGVPKRERSTSPDCLSPDTMNPPSPADSNDELKPQPIIKKSRKQFVPDDLKDDKYWARRRKNNLAAKRSRDARRMKENQIALRAGYLEKENMGLRQELERLKKENLLLQNKLSKYEDV